MPHKISQPPPAALNAMFQEVVKATPQNLATRFSRPEIRDRWERLMAQPAKRNLFIGVTVLTGGAALLLYGAYQGLRGRFARQVRPDMVFNEHRVDAEMMRAPLRAKAKALGDGDASLGSNLAIGIGARSLANVANDLNQHNPVSVLKTGVSKSEWSAISKLARSGRDGHAQATRDAIIRSNALKLINLRPDAATVKPLLDKCSTGQLCQLARLVVKERAEPPQQAQPGRLPVSARIFARLREVQVEVQKSFSLDEHTLNAIAQQARQAEGIAASYASVPAAPPGQVDPPAADPATMIRGFAAELTSPYSLGDASQAHRLLKVCETQAEALATILEAPDQAKEAGLPAPLVDALVSLKAQFQPVVALAQPGDNAAEPQAAGAAAQMRTAIRNLSELERSIINAKLGEAVDESVNAFDFEPFTNRLRELIDEGAPEAAAKLLDAIATRYFTDQSIQDKKSLLSAMWRGSTHLQSFDRQVVELLKGAGPVMHKIMQGVSENLINTESRQIFGEVKSKLSPIDPVTKRALLDQIVRDSRGAIRSLTSVRNLSAASVGDTLLADVQNSRGEEQRLVVKLLRPGIRERAEREQAMFAQIAKDDPGMLKTVTNFINPIVEEMDLSGEGEHISQAQVYHEREAGIAIMRAVDLVPQHPNYILLEQAPGKNLQDIKRLLEKISNNAAHSGGDADLAVDLDAPENQATGLSREQNRARQALQIGLKLEKRMAQLSSLWLNEALLGSGFYHGDLHGGNMMYSASDDVLTMIDLGNAARGTREDRQSLARLLAALEFRHPRLFLEGLAPLLEPEARMRIEEILRDADKMAVFRGLTAPIIKGDVGSDFPKLLQFLQGAMGVEIPAYVLQFGRSMGMLLSEMSTLNEINERLFLKSQPGFSVSARRYEELTAAISEAEADYRRALKTSNKRVLVENARAAIDDLNSADPSAAVVKHALEPGEAVEKQATDATQELKARLDGLKKDLSELRAKASSELPSVDGQSLIARDLTQKRRALLDLVGLEFAARMQFDALGADNEELERMFRTAQSPGIEAARLNVGFMTQLLDSELPSVDPEGRRNIATE